MATVRQLINRSLRLVGAISSGETATADEMQDTLTALNGMLEQWSNEGLAVYEQVDESFSIVADQYSYTIGTGGDFDTDRPLRIINAIVRDSNGQDYPVGIITSDQYQSISNKTDSGSTYPRYMYYDTSYPLGNITFYPVPSENSTLIMTMWQQFTTYDTDELSEEVQVPPGYNDAIVYNLALRIAPEFGIQAINPEIRETAVRTMANIKRVNTKPRVAAMDAAIMGSGYKGNALSGSYFPFK